MDNPKKQKLDRRLVSLKQQHERRYWTKKLGVTLERLREAVNAVGHSVSKLREHLTQDRFTRGDT